MRTCFHTNAFAWAGETDIERIADYALSAGFTGLEVGPMIKLDLEAFKRVQNKIDIAAFIYCRNFIADDNAVAEAERRELYGRMKFAASLGVKKIITSTGISNAKSFGSSGCDPLKSLADAADFLKELLALAEELDMYVCLENCPMYRNIATSPLMWDKLFEAVPSKRLGLCYDASHFIWQFIDVYSPLEKYADKIFHLHLKDTKLYPDKLHEVGILHNTGAERGFDENQWWRHTLICEGETDWKRFLTLVKGLKSPLLDISFEMEDYKYEREVEKVKQGLSIQLARYNEMMNLLA